MARAARDSFGGRIAERRIATVRICSVSCGENTVLFHGLWPLATRMKTLRLFMLVGLARTHSRRTTWPSGMAPSATATSSTHGYGQRQGVSIVPSFGTSRSGCASRYRTCCGFPHKTSGLQGQPNATGIPFIGPWANRLDEQAFYANGKRYSFDMDLGNVRGAIPIHGFLTTTDLWQVVASEGRPQVGVGNQPARVRDSRCG